jgi:hypothetical protein
MERRFKIEGVITRQYRRFNAVGFQLTVRMQPPPDGANPVSHFLACVNDLFEHALQGVSDSDMVGITIQNKVNQNDKAIGISFRRKDQLSGDVIWSVFEKVAQSNSRFNALDKLVVTVHSVKMPVGFGRVALKTMGRPISAMAHLKQSIIEVKAEENFLANAPLPSHLVPRRPKHSPQHPILQHSQPTFFPQCQQPIFKPIQNNTQNYSSVHFIPIFLYSKLQDKRFCTEL